MTLPDPTPAENTTPSATPEHESPAPPGETTAAAPASGAVSQPLETPAASGAPESDSSAAAVPPPTDEGVMIDALKEVIDPELMINIVDLGLVYNITLDERTVHIDMTLTSPACPAGPQIVQQSKMAVERIPGIEKANIRLVMTPPWSPARMTDEARDILGIF